MAAADQIVCICRRSRRSGDGVRYTTPRRIPNPLCPVHGDPRDTSVDQVRPIGNRGQVTGKKVDAFLARRRNGEGG